MKTLRMTSDPTAATIFAVGDGLDQAMKFAEDYQHANFHTMPMKWQRSADATGVVHLPTFCGDLWVAKN
jgi:hypothetical protein